MGAGAGAVFPSALHQGLDHNQHGGRHHQAAGVGHPGPRAGWGLRAHRRCSPWSPALVQGRRACLSGACLLPTFWASAAARSCSPRVYVCPLSSASGRGLRPHHRYTPLSSAFVQGCRACLSGACVLPTFCASTSASSWSPGVYVCSCLGSQLPTVAGPRVSDTKFPEDVFEFVVLS